MDKWASLSAEEAAAQITRTNEKWGGQVGQPATITYGFSDAPEFIFEEQQIVPRFSAAQIAATEEVLALWADLANINFIPVKASQNYPDVYISPYMAQINFLDYAKMDGSSGHKTGTIGESVVVGFNLYESNVSDLRVRPNTFSRIAKLSQHETNGGEFQEGQSVAVVIFPVFGKAAATVEPRNRTFDDPTLG